MEMQTEEDEEDVSPSSCMMGYIVRANDQTVAGSASLTSSNLQANKGKKKRKSEVADRRRPRLAPHRNKVTFDCQNSKRFRIKNVRRISEAQKFMLKKAKEVQANLSTEHPSFIKQILRSHVIRSFMLVVPAEFTSHLPTHSSVDVILEDESGESFVVRYIPGIKEIKGRFIGGWKRFSVAHKLLQGDVAVFHLLRPCYFKVYIIKANDPTVPGSSLGARSNKGKKRKQVVAERNGSRLTPRHDTLQEGTESNPLLSNSDLEPEPDPDHQPSKEEPNSSDVEASALSGTIADFEKFKIIVNNEVIDPELSRSIRFKYYNLCCSQKSYLHRKILKNVDRTLAAGVIAGTVKVAETIRACKLYASDDDFAMWDNTLEGLKRFGMDVGFLCDRLKRLVSLASEFRATEEVKKYIEARNKLECVEEKMKTTEMEFLELKQSKNKLEDEMKTVKLNIDKCKDTFLEEVIAPL